MSSRHQNQPDEMNSREIILQRIKQSLRTPSQLPDAPDDTEIRFSNKLTSTVTSSPSQRIKQLQHEIEAVNGEFFKATSVSELLSQIRALLHTTVVSFSISGDDVVRTLANDLAYDMTFVDPQNSNFYQKMPTVDIGLYEAAYAIADTGTVVVPFSSEHSTLPLVLPETTIAIVRAERILPNQFELFDTMEPEIAKHMLMITGPSRTADIEKILILGAHGPKRLIVAVLENLNNNGR